MAEPIIEARAVEKCFVQPEGGKIEVIAATDLAIYPQTVVGTRTLVGHGTTEKGLATASPFVTTIVSMSFWLRGVDLNHRPLGYEGNSTNHARQSQPMKPNKTADLAEHPFSHFWSLSAAVFGHNSDTQNHRTPAHVYPEVQ